MIAELATTTLTTSPSSVKWSTLIFGAGHSREVQKYESMKDVAKTDEKPGFVLEYYIGYPKHMDEWVNKFAKLRRCRKSLGPINQPL